MANLENKTFRVLLARLGAHAVENIDAFGVAALRADRTTRPKYAFELREGGGFIVWKWGAVRPPQFSLRARARS